MSNKANSPGATMGIDIGKNGSVLSVSTGATRSCCGKGGCAARSRHDLQICRRNLIGMKARPLPSSESQTAIARRLRRFNVGEIRAALFEAAKENDFRDVEAIGEAVQRCAMTYYPRFPSPPGCERMRQMEDRSSRRMRNLVTQVVRSRSIRTRAR
jgi:hypothetical protein